MSLSLLSDQSNFSFANVSQELVAVFTLTPGSDFGLKVQEGLNSKISELESKNIKVILVSSESGEGDTNWVLDLDGEIISQAENIKNKNGENLVLFKKDGESLKYLVHKDAPEHEYDWIKVVSDFADNFFNPEPENGAYKWGQVVPEDGDYLCIDCGYIGTFSAGEVFPVCEVCLSGEPAGPTSADGAYWEKI